MGSALYGALAYSDGLFQLNPGTGGYISDVDVTLAGVEVDGAGGLATGPDTGMLWIVVNPPGQTQYLGTVDPATGVATSVGTLPDDFVGLAFVPEPSTTLGLGAGAIAVALCALHRQRRRGRWS